MAAENVYGNVAKQIGGLYVAVTSIINNPVQDPHLLTITPKIVKAIEEAEIIILNGAGYDPWINALLTQDIIYKKTIIEIAKLINIDVSRNPHLWFKPDTIPIFAHLFTLTLIKIDHTHKKEYEEKLVILKNQAKFANKIIKQLKMKYNGLNVIATESIYNYLTEAIGLKMEGLAFQQNIMNDIPPSIHQVQSFEQSLRQHKVKLLIYNKQVNNPITQQMIKIAEEENIPVLGVTEIMPNNITYYDWLTIQLHELEKALKNTRLAPN